MMLLVAAEDFLLLLFVVVSLIFMHLFFALFPRVFRYNQFFLGTYGPSLLTSHYSFSYIHTPGCFADTTGNKSNYNRDKDVVLFVILWLFVC